MNTKYITLTDDIYHYVTTHHSAADDPGLAGLRAETEKLGGISRMQISPEQGAFMSLLIAASGARSAIEVGTFTGYSAICIARGLPADGKLICCDISEEWTSIARRYWSRAGVADKIELRLGPAADTLRGLETGLQFDFAFIDADKTGYDAYYELILPRLRPNGVIIFDNMLRGGKVAQPPLTDSDDQAVDALNKKLAHDARVESVLLPLADGLHICRKRDGEA
ncbi:MAG: O-methyltransferase [Armatimonadota bacterium]|nr:O-methyltransferase [Armatimonadota bacterium]